MKPFFHISILAVFLALANTAAAQERLDCPSVVDTDGVDPAAPSDIVHQPLAMPGAFGGEVFCLRRFTAQGIEQFFVESLPFNGEMAQDFQYLSNSILYSVKVGAPDAPPVEAVGCVPIDDENFKCFADLSLGNRINAVIYYRVNNASSSIYSAAIVVYPGYGVIPPDVWQRLQLLDPTGPDLGLTIFVGANDATEMLPLSIEFSKNNDFYYFVARGQSAFDYLVAQSNEDFEVTITAAVKIFESNDSGSRLTTNRYTSIIGTQPTWFLMNKLFQLSDLMSAGFEGSKALSFEN